VKERLVGLSLAANTLFDFNQLVDIQGKPFSMSAYKGNASLVINVASF